MVSDVAVGSANRDASDALVVMRLGVKGALPDLVGALNSNSLFASLKSADLRMRDR